LASEANVFFEEGNYVQAYAAYSQLVSLYGSNPIYAFRFGAAGIYATTDREKCVFFMKDGVRRGYTEPETHYYLARAYHLSYNFKEAIAEYEKFETSAEKKQLAKSDCKAQKLSAESGLNLMNSIKDVQVLEKTEAEKSSFYRYMNIDPSIGKIISTPKELLSKLDLKSKEEHVFFLPTNGKKIFFSSKGKDGLTGKDIYTTSRVNGTFTPPVKLKSSVNTEFDEDFAFMHPNGSTLYFASKGHGSMGGYDIFRCEWDSTISDFGPAINMDFAINTPDDDLFFITDSLNTTAYFASSRLTSPDKLYVYRVFVNGIPMNITYLKGEFISRVDVTQTEAKIQVFDDLTNRKIMDTQSRASNGQYLLFIPTAGNYTYKIQPPGSPQIHEVLVKIPAAEGSQVFRQEIVFTKTDGREKVEVKNYWNDPLNDNVEDLQRQMLLAKSQLDVNATVDLSSFTSTNTNNANSNTSASGNASTTVLNPRVEIDTVLSSQEKTIAALKREIALAEQTSKLLLQYVQQTLSETDEAYEEFQTARFEKPESQNDSIKLTETRNNMVATQDRSVAAISAYEISKNREIELREKLNSVQSVNKQIKESLAEKDSPMAAYLVNDYVAKNPNSEKGLVTENAVTWKAGDAKSKVNENKAQFDDSQLRINTKTKEIEELEIKANALSAQMSNTKKKKDIERLGNELNSINLEYTELKEEIEEEKENLRVRELELQESVSLFKLLQELESDKQPEVKPEFKSLTNTVNIESLKTEISESKNRVSTALENAHYENPSSTNNASSNNASSNNASSNNASSNNASSNNASSNNANSDNASSNNGSSNNASSNNASSNNASSNNANSDNASSNNANSDNASSNNGSSNNASSNNASSNNANSDNASSNNANSDNASSNNANSDNASSNNGSSNNASSNNAGSNNASSNNASSNNASSNNANSDNASSNNGSSNNASSNNASSNNASSNNANSDNASSNNASSNNANSDNASSNNGSSNNASSNNASSNNANSDNASSNNGSSNNASSNNAGSNNASSNNASSNNASSNNDGSNNASSNNASSNNASSNRTFTTSESTIINSPGQSNYQDENIFEELKNDNVEISNRIEIEKLYTEIETINRRIKNETAPEKIAELTEQRNQLMYEKMQEEDKNSTLIAEHNSIALIDLQTAWKNNTSAPTSNETLEDKKSYDTAVSYMKEASTLRAAAKTETDFFERYAKNARAFALERNAKNELQFLVEKTTPSANNASSNNAISNNASSNNASSNNASSNNASSFTSIPAIIQKTLYQKQTVSAYSDANPIPIGLPLPEGSFYTIQVGAFRLPVANNTFSQFAPVYAERQTNGFIRYSTGFFSSYTEAIQARNEIRQMGYSDAFIVAYKNRERVRYSDLMTAAERANSNSNSAASTNTTPAPIVTPNTNLDVNYYSDPLAVSANLIETTEGIFFTVQVGVYAKPSRNKILNTYSDLHVEKLSNGQIRYTSGKFQSIADVIKQRDFVRANGIPDAFITAYKNGKRITVPEAKKELGIQ
jgi:hypothetical protein